MPIDERLQRDLAKATGPTDNAGRPVVSPQYDKFTFTPPTQVDIERYRAGEVIDLIARMKELPEVLDVAGRAGQDGPVDEMLHAIACMVIGWAPPEMVEDDEADQWSEHKMPAGFTPKPGWVSPDHPLAVDTSVPRGDMVVTGTMPGPFPTETKPPAKPPEMPTHAPAGNPRGDDAPHFPGKAPVSAP